MKSLLYLPILGWLVLAGYLASAGFVLSKSYHQTITPDNFKAGDKSSGYEYEGLNFADEKSLMEFLSEKNSGKWFPWIFELPRDLGPLIAALSFGLFGGATRLVHEKALKSRDPAISRLIFTPVFSAIIGLLLYLLSLVVPAAFVSVKTPIRPEIIAAISLFGGLFSEKAYAWIENQVGKLFPATAPKPTRTN